MTTEAVLRSSVRRGWYMPRWCITPGLFLGRQTISNLFQRLFLPINHLFCSLIDNTLSVTALSENNSKQLCTTQFGRFFATARIPRIGRDEIKTVDLSRHIVVICRNQFFSGKSWKKRSVCFSLCLFFQIFSIFHHHLSLSTNINHHHRHHHHHQRISINQSFESNQSINQSIVWIKSINVVLCSDCAGRKVSHSSSSSNAHSIASRNPSPGFRQRGPRPAALVEVPGIARKWTLSLFDWLCLFVNCFELMW